ncbi:hypothetical protein HG535_0D01650 [Zygotorulaspora mrakii]|uniref:Autophagy-related protein 20 n=1 Tax=Zygotorulaspora mrakii TaxID=42260 RepID=A0A7H9B1T8_ZYGMR|nr:uncharacterized protein HG535_0D01650 [Zygotorulaspora mrakii]QLG72457.1 hypothetical protein HG535_0D01650 [Zygotorulaspora mrakii]
MNVNDENGYSNYSTQPLNMSAVEHVTHDDEPATSGSNLLAAAVDTAGVEDHDEADDGRSLSEASGSKESSDLKASSVDQSMVHTAITVNDNPFIDQEEKLFGINGNGSTEVYDGRSAKVKPFQNGKSLVNPNDIYQDDLEDLLPLNHGPSETTRNSSGDDSISVSNHNGVPPSSHNDIVAVGNAKHEINRRPKAQILEANKLSEGQGRTYIAYTIRYEDSLVRRRYSDFESLRNILVKLFPMTLLPPIPEKQSFKTYGKAIAGSKSNYLLPSEGTGSVDLSLSVINGSVNNSDERLIRHRIRMLTGFLNKLLQNEEITKTTIISDFLDPNNSNWNDFVTSSATFSSLPKSVLQCNPLDPTNTTRIHASLPVVHSTSQSILNKDSSSATLESKDGFVTIEQDYKRYESILNNGLYKYNRRITKNFHDLKCLIKELGEAYAQFATNQNRGADLAEQFSHISDTFDEYSIQLDNLVGKFYYNINEPLSECVHMAGSAKDLIKYRKLKLMQTDMIKKSLQNKKQQLAKLQEHEKDVQDVESQVNEEVGSSQKINLQHPQPRSYSGKLFNKFNKLATMVKESVSYQDPDLHTTMESLKKDIKELEKSSKVCESDMTVITEVIKDQQLSAFSKQREQELVSILENYSKYMREYAEKNLEIWREIKAKQAQ